MAVTRRVDYEQVKHVPPEPDWGVGADEMWERLKHFLVRIVPAAEQAGVRLASHIQDRPQTAQLKGEARPVCPHTGSLAKPDR